MTTRTIVLPELRMPFEDRTAWATVLTFIADYRPDQVIQLGHLLNLPPCGRFSGQATLELRRRELHHTADYVRHHYLARIRKAHDGPLRIVYSAASGRLAAALHSTARPDTGAASTCVERLVHLDTRDGVELAAVATVAPGWTLLYGDNLTVADSDVPGASALRIAQHLGVCVIVGHTMRLGKASYTITGTDGGTHTVTGVETGTLVDQQHAKATNGHTHGWQRGLVIVETHGGRVSVDCLALTANRAAVRWAGQPRTSDVTALQPQPIAAHAVGEAAAVGVGHRSARAV